MLFLLFYFTLRHCLIVSFLFNSTCGYCPVKSVMCYSTFRYCLITSLLFHPNVLTVKVYPCCLNLSFSSLLLSLPPDYFFLNKCLMLSLPSHPICVNYLILSLRPQPFDSHGPILLLSTKSFDLTVSSFFFLLNHLILTVPNFFFLLNHSTLTVPSFFFSNKSFDTH